MGLLTGCHATSTERREGVAVTPTGAGGVHLPQAQVRVCGGGGGGSLWYKHGVTRRPERATTYTNTQRPTPVPPVPHHGCCLYAGSLKQFRSKALDPKWVRHDGTVPTRLLLYTPTDSLVAGQGQHPHRSGWVNGAPVQRGGGGKWDRLWGTTHNSH